MAVWPQVPQIRAKTEQITEGLEQCKGLSVLRIYYESWFSVMDPGSYNNNNKKGGEKFVLLPFL